MAVVDPAGDDVEEVDRASEVQAELRPLHHVPQSQGAEVNVRRGIIIYSNGKCFEKMQMFKDRKLTEKSDELYLASGNQRLWPSECIGR